MVWLTSDEYIPGSLTLQGASGKYTISDCLGGSSLVILTLP